MREIRLREARIADAETIAQIQVRTWRFAYRGLVPDELLGGLSVEKRAARWQEIIGRPESGSFTLVAESGEGIIGWCCGGKCRDNDAVSDCGEIYGIYVSPESMGRSAGSLLMARALERLGESGFPRATLWVLTANRRSRDWYESRGWTLEGKAKAGLFDGYELHETRYRHGAPDR